jgi:hypothetical protein
MAADASRVFALLGPSTEVLARHRSRVQATYPRVRGTGPRPRSASSFRLSNVSQLSESSIGNRYVGTEKLSLCDPRRRR